MPRIYDSASNPIDFCQTHFPKSEAIAEKKYGDVTKTGDGPDERGNCFSYDDDHPDYDDCEYRCEVCNRPLIGKDNWK